MKKADVDQFEKIVGQLHTFYDEISILSKKSPTDPINKFKLKFINSALKLADDFLGKAYRPFDGFSDFDEDDLPNNSDIVFILAQYIQGFEKMRADNTVFEYEEWFWKIEITNKDDLDQFDRVDAEDEYGYIRTVKPGRLR